jgi:non-ribosomal peptide synthase protein (TIGR01720 family)
LDTEAGPVVRAARFEWGKGGGRLLVVAHHLVIDGVSWRILLDEVERRYAELSARVASGTQPADLSAGGTRPTASAYRQWVSRLVTEAASDETLGELSYWQQQVGAGDRLPRDHERGGNTVDSSDTVAVEFDAAQTSALLRDLPRRLRAQAEEVLLYAVSEALCRWTGRPEAVIACEGHGREPLGGMEPSRSVGWFTTLYPVRLRRAEGGVAERLTAVREQLRGVPRKGMGYGLLKYVRAEASLAGADEPEVSFNYLGQWDANLGGLFRGAAESAGESQWGGEERPSVLEVHGSVSEGRLRMGWTYSRNLHTEESVARVAGWFREAVEEAIAASLSEGHSATPPTEVSDVDFSDAEWQALLTAIRS